VTRDATTAFARTVVDEWARAGVAHAVVAPGSRSAPLALALASDARLRVHVILDERSAGFFALGVGRATGMPAIVLCTSGTAAAGFHPAVLEAGHGRVPLLFCTADRPPELRAVGAGQTVDQVSLFGAVPRLALDVPPPEDRPGSGPQWRSLAARAFAATRGTPAGPVHLNLGFREPLVPTGAPLVDAPGRTQGRPWAVVDHGPSRVGDDVVDALAARVGAAPRGVVVAGWGAEASVEAVRRFGEASGWPVLADPLSGLRTHPDTVSAYDALLRIPDPSGARVPEVVLRLGAMPTSKALCSLLAPPVSVIRVDPAGAWLDPNRADEELIEADPDELLHALAVRLEPPAAPAWRDGWADADRVARRALDAFLDEQEAPFEGRIARDLLAALPEGSDLFVASSMPIRDLDTFGAPRQGVRVLANRGVNGIDGLVSTGLGIATATPARHTVALLGDLAFLHDTNGLLGARTRGVSIVYVVADNDGGGIFSFLPQAELPEHFEQLFGTPHGIDLAGIAAAHSVPFRRVLRSSDLAPALSDALDAGGVQILHVRTDRATNAALHRDALAAVERAMARSPR
jgi:2-succinyl-5-enolpyruvyl-6-hydroxy-3-cyclohexene-1-carboxylate synthase